MWINVVAYFNRYNSVLVNRDEKFSQNLVPYVQENFFVSVVMRKEFGKLINAYKHLWKQILDTDGK